MIFITGGMCQGKLELALRLAGVDGKAGESLTDISVAEGKTDPVEAAWSRPVIHGLADYVRRVMERDGSVEAFLDGIVSGNQEVVVTSDEVGCGIVPTDPAERAWREEAGRAAVFIASRSRTVYRMVCGIPQKIKG